MEKEIKDGEYIRTKTGKIGKVIDISNVTGQKRKKYLIKWAASQAYFITDINIVKHSDNIADILEYGDYVNGQEVVTVYGYDNDGNDRDELGVIQTDYDEAYGMYLEEIKIENIVTKEQFESVKFKI